MLAPTGGETKSPRTIGFAVDFYPSMRAAWVLPALGLESRDCPLIRQSRLWLGRRFFQARTIQLLGS